MCSQTAIQRYLASRIGAGRVTVPQVSRRPAAIATRLNLPQLMCPLSLCQIYIKGKLIGGNSDLQALHANGDLAKLLA